MADEPVVKPEEPAPIETPAPMTQAEFTRQMEMRDRILSSNLKALKEINDKLEIAQKNVTAAPAVVDDPKKFWENPEERLAARIKTELAEQVKPLQDFVNQQKAVGEYEQVKNRFKASSHGKLLNSQLEQVVDNIMGGRAQSDEAYQAAVFAAIGMAKSGLINGYTETVDAAPVVKDTSTQTKPVNNLPPHLRPTPTQVDTTQNQPKLRELNELEKRLAKENSLTPEQYLKLQGADPSEVTKIDINPPAAK